MSQEVSRARRGRVEVLRIGHRPERDKRITTHVALVARAFGAQAVRVDNADAVLERTVLKVNEQFGGDFLVQTGVGFRKVMRKWKGTIVHLTMYGMPLSEGVREVPPGEDVLVVVGSEKVPREVYDTAHLNISVTSQPHSEVSSLALFLDRLFSGGQMDLTFPGGAIRILPSARGKTVTAADAPKARGPTAPSFAKVPTPDECIGILDHLGCPPAVLEHIKAVYALGDEMIRVAIEADPSIPDRLDLGVVRAGLMLHDIGRTRTHSIRHVSIGADIATRMGLDPRVVAAVHNHIGAGVPASEAVVIGLSEEDFMPCTMEEKIVCHADSLIADRKRTSLDEARSDLIKKGATSGADRMAALHLEIEGFLGIDLDLLLPP